MAIQAITLAKRRMLAHFRCFSASVEQPFFGWRGSILTYAARRLTTDSLSLMTTEKILQDLENSPNFCDSLIEFSLKTECILLFINLINFSSNLHSCLVRCIYLIDKIFTASLSLEVQLTLLKYSCSSSVQFYEHTPKCEKWEYW
jgi:hypothetical protein